MAEAFSALEAQQRVLEQELAEAANYVQSLLPAVMPAGSPVPADWRFITSSPPLGGDSFGYHWISPHQLAIYLLDVCGHGVGAALLSVSAINTIRNRSLPGTDFTIPSQVLSGLNRAFPMEEHGGKYFTIFYAIYDTVTREIIYASGGHPPAISIAPGGSVHQLVAQGMIIGALPFAKYVDYKTTLAPGTRLFVFSDGCYEIFNAQQDMMTLERFAEILVSSAPHAEPLDHAVDAARQWQQRNEFDDDFSLMQFQL